MYIGIMTTQLKEKQHNHKGGSKAGWQPSTQPSRLHLPRSGLLNWRAAVRIRTFQVLKLDLKLQDEFALNFSSRPFLIMGDGISFTSAAIRRCPAYGGGDL